jgi:predicted TPR repeat methyltransferase
MLKRVYNLTSTAEAESVYDDWAGTYDTDTTDGMGYVAPGIAADRLAGLAPAGAVVLDAGCGTGLVGAELGRRGFTTIDGIDLSQGMLDQARTKGCYRTLQKADLSGRLTYDDNAYDATICVGTLTEGHVGPEALDELIRVTRGHLVLTVLGRIWESLGYHAYIDGLAERGAARLVEAEERPYHQAEGITCRLVVLQAR